MARRDREQAAHTGEAHREPLDPRADTVELPEDAGQAELAREPTAAELIQHYDAAKDAVTLALAVEREAFARIEARVAARWEKTRAIDAKAPGPIVVLGGQKFIMRRGRGDKGPYLDKLAASEEVLDF